MSSFGVAFFFFFSFIPPELRFSLLTENLRKFEGKVEAQFRLGRGARYFNNPIRDNFVRSVQEIIPTRISLLC